MVPQMNNAHKDDLRSRNLPLALHHANLIQQRKDVEMTIFASLEELIDYPTSDTADPAHPTAQDLAAFRKHVAPFQTSDYDDLIEERNAARKCGYVFCPRPFKRSTWDEVNGGHLRVVFGKSEPGRGRSLTFVPNSKVPRWCSDDCAERAMYIKVQMNPLPAWQRGPERPKQIEVLKVTSAGEQEALNNIMGRLDLKDNAGHDELREAMAKLAIERGDLVKGSAKAVTASNNKNDISVRENPPTQTSQQMSGSPQQLPSSASSNHMSIEGYNPKTPGSRPDAPQRDPEEAGDDWMDYEV